MVVTKAKDIYDGPDLVEEVTPDSIKKDLSRLKEDHSKSEESQYFKDKNDGFTKIFDNLVLAEDKIQIFKAPLRRDITSGKPIEIPKQVIKMIDSVPYIKVSKINPPISKDSYEKISIFYGELQEYAKEQGQKLVFYTKRCLDPKNLQGTFEILKLVNEINNIKKFFELKSITNKEEFDSVSSHYTKMIESLCNMVGFKNETTVEDEMGWMGYDKMQQRLKEMSFSEIEALLNRNPFVFILKSIEFISNIKPPQSYVSDFLHVSIDEIRNSIFEEINKLKSGLIEVFNKSIIEIKQVINEFLRNNRDENEIEKLDENLKQAINLNDKYLDEYISVLQKSITVSDSDIESKLGQLKHKYLDILGAYQQDLSSFPVYTIKSSLGSSFSETQTRLNYLRKKLLEEAQLKIKSLDQAIIDTKDEQERMKLKAEKEKLETTEKISIQALQLSKLTTECNTQKYMKEFIKEKNEVWGQDCKNYINSTFCNWDNPHQCVRGYEIVLNEVMNLTQQKNANRDKFNHDTKHFFVVYAAKEISVKSDVKITYKGGNVVFVAPIININAKLDIDLSGNDGLSYAGYTAKSGTWNSYSDNGKDGESGRNGESGKLGGNIIMIAQEYKGLDQNLRININGGNGGDGENGGNGGSYDTVHVFTRPSHRNGGKGGDGGYAGSGGQFGHVKIFQSKNDITTNVSNVVQQKNGINGKPGEGGKGGKPWESIISKSADGQLGADGSKGGIVNKISKEAKIDSLMGYDYIKNDYIKFMTNYAPEALNHPSEYVDISGHATDYDSFL